MIKRGAGGALAQGIAIPLGHSDCSTARTRQWYGQTAHLTLPAAMGANPAPYRKRRASIRVEVPEASWSGDGKERAPICERFGHGQLPAQRKYNATGS